MNFDDVKQVWIRVCPICSVNVEHKTKAKCRDAENHNRPCITCSRSAIGKKNAVTDHCPICNETFAYRHELNTHAASHNKTGEELWSIKCQMSPPSCRCGCGQKTSFIEWNKGWTEFVNGHNASIYSSYSAEEATKIAATRGANWKTQNYWKGKTKETDVEVAQRAEATSRGRKKAFKEGKLQISWKGQTKETNSTIAKFSAHLKELYSSGQLTSWTKGKTKHTDKRIAQMAIKISTTLKQKDLRKRLDEIKLLPPSEVQKRIEENSYFELTNDVNYIRRNYANIEVRCKSCKKNFVTSLHRLITGVRCGYCYPSQSVGQSQILAFIREELGIDAQANVRNIIAPLELDIFVPSFNFAIEFNGLYWHSELHKSSNYHEHKRLLCQEKQIELIQIFEDEWREFPEIIQNLIRQKLNLLPKVNSQTIISFAKKEDQKAFLCSNHLEGYENSVAGLCLLDDQNNAIAMLGLRASKKQKFANYFEINRFCTKLGIDEIQPFFLLLEAAREYAKINNKDGIIFQSDSRLGTDPKLQNFVLINSEIAFWWTDCRDRFNQYKFKADTKEHLTERQVAQQFGVVKIWGCSKHLYAIRA